VILGHGPVVAQHRARSDQPSKLLWPGGVAREQRIEAPQPCRCERRTRARAAQLAFEALAVDPERLGRSDHQRSVRPECRVRKDIEEGTHDQFVLCVRTVADPLEHQALALQDGTGQPEVLDRIEIPCPGMDRLDQVGCDDVVLLRGEHQVVAPVVYAEPHVRPAQHVVIDVAKPVRAAHHRL
jgi:hypothetical protein